MLRCSFCRYEYDSKKLTGLEKDLSKLEGENVASGAKNIEADAKDIITLKCESCGAEVVINSKEATQARCHWCRNTLSLNKQIPNGAVPDVILPFKIEKKVAQEEIDKFVKKRNFFANPAFKREFASDNIMQVYFPYMLVDVNGHGNFIGEGEIKTRQYTSGSDENERTYYDANLYHIERSFDITINELSIESSLDRLNSTSKAKTNNIINSIMPFDTENCIKYDANFLKGCTSDLDEVVEMQAKDVAKISLNKTIKDYDRGVAWQQEDFEVKGKQWVAAYLPVWLYSYQQIKGNKKILHYVAVNARTKETMGSIPISMKKLLLITFILEVIGLILMLLTYDLAEKSDTFPNFLFLFIGVIFFFIKYYKYRNQSARHSYERETKNELTNIECVDDFIKERKKLENPKIKGCNNYKISGEDAKNKQFGTAKKIRIGTK